MAFCFDKYLFISFPMLQYTQKKNRMYISSTGPPDDLYVNKGVRYCELQKHFVVRQEE